MAIRVAAGNFAARAMAASTGKRSSAPSTPFGYEGPLAVEWSDAGMNRDFGAEEAYKFVKRLDFDPAPLQ